MINVTVLAKVLCDGRGEITKGMHSCAVGSGYVREWVRDVACFDRYVVWPCWEIGEELVIDFG